MKEKNEMLDLTKLRKGLRTLVRVREDFQAMRKRMDNRLGRKADGTMQDVDDRGFDIMHIDNFNSVSEAAKQQEEEIEEMLLQTLRKFPIYNNFLKDVKGVGPLAAAWIISEFDIYKATAVSKMWQYAGLNPSLVRGKKRIGKKSYKPEMGEIINEMPNKRTESVDCIIQTSDLIKGDRPTEGYVLPYNKNLRTRLVGVLADGFIKAKSSYALEFYYPYKARLEKEENVIETYGRERKDSGKKWSEVSKSHRDMAAKRYMIKMFLKDLYVAWREIEGLPVRPPYEEEYLGKKHSTKKPKNQK
jgi:hypothetical protein